MDKIDLIVPTLIILVLSIIFGVIYFYVKKYRDIQTNNKVEDLFEEIQKPTNERPPVDEDYKRETQKVFIKRSVKPTDADRLGGM